MSFLFNSAEDMDKKVRNLFGDRGSYLIVFKHNSPGKNLGKMILSSLYYLMDNSRTFILYFNEKGIYESEISNSDKKDFLFMAWNEIESFDLIEKSKRILKINHLGKVYEYEIDLNGIIFSNNAENLVELKDKNWYRIG